MRYIDLTHTIVDDMPSFPGDIPVLLKSTMTCQKDGFANHSLHGGVHMGTHIDAPGHFIENGKKIIDFPVSSFIGKALVINACGKKEIDTNAVYGKVQEGDCVLFYTGWDRQFNEKEYFYEHPVLQEECAQYLIDCKVKMVGVDFPSVDKFPYSVHKMLLGNDILIIENITHLEKVKDYATVRIMALPLKIDAHGAPARVVAIVE